MMAVPVAMVPLELLELILMLNYLLTTTSRFIRIQGRCTEEMNSIFVSGESSAPFRHAFDMNDPCIFISFSSNGGKGGKGGNGGLYKFFSFSLLLNYC